MTARRTNQKHRPTRHRRRRRHDHHRLIVWLIVAAVASTIVTLYLLHHRAAWWMVPAAFCLGVAVLHLLATPTTRRRTVKPHWWHTQVHRVVAGGRVTGGTVAGGAGGGQGAGVPVEQALPQPGAHAAERLTPQRRAKAKLAAAQELADIRGWGADLREVWAGIDELEAS